MASMNIVLPVVKGTDFDYYQALGRIAESDAAITLALKLCRFTFPSSFSPTIENIAFEEAAENDTLKKLFSADARTLQTIGLYSSVGSVTFGRTENFHTGDASGHQDKLTVTLIDNANEKQRATFAVLIADVQNAVKTFSVSGLVNLLGAESAAHFKAREEALTRLEALQAKLLHDFETLKQKHYSDLDDKQANLDKTFQERQETLYEEHKNRQQELDARKAAMDEAKAKLDDRSSTHVRRELREKLKEILKERQTSFALSSDTQKRRYWVLGGYIALLLFLGGIAISFLVLESRSSAGTPNYWHIGRQLGATVTFFLTMGFFLRWMNSWAQQHAEEEFKLKQLEVDIDRASWVVEMAFEWDEAKANPIPQQLIETLSANLFGQKAESRELAMTAGDAIAKSLAGIPSATAEIHFPGGKITLDKKALQQAKKIDSKESD